MLKQSITAPVFAWRVAVMSEYLTPREAGKLLRKATTTLKNWRVHGKGPRFIRVNRSILYDRKDIEEHIEKSKYKSTSEYDAKQRRLIRPAS